MYRWIFEGNRRCSRRPQPFHLLLYETRLAAASSIVVSVVQLKLELSDSREGNSKHFSAKRGTFLRVDALKFNEKFIILIILMENFDLPIVLNLKIELQKDGKRDQRFSFVVVTFIRVFDHKAESKR